MQFLKSKLAGLWFRYQWAKIGVIYLKSQYFSPKYLVICGKKIEINFPSNEHDVLMHELGRIYFHDCYRLKKIRNAPSVIVDIGANVGLFSIIARHHFPNARILAFEPNPELHVILKSHLDPLGVEVFPYAVGLEDCRVTLHQSNNSLLTTSLPVVNGETEQVSSKKILKMAGGNIDLLKMDCEGAEWSIMKDEDSMRFVKNIVMEYHLWASKGSKFEQIENHFKKIGFELTWHDNKENLQWGLAGFKKHS